MSPTVWNCRPWRLTIAPNNAPGTALTSLSPSSATCRPPPLLRLPGQPPHSLGRERQLMREAADRPTDSGGHSCADRVQRPLARALGPVGPDAVATFGQDLIELVWEIAASR